MGKKKTDRTKQFHFKLVNRSMADPDHDMPDAGQHVLVPYVPSNLKKKGFQELEAPGAKLGLDDSVFGIHDNLGEDEKERYERRIYGLKDEDVAEVLPGEEDAEALDGDCYFPADGYNYDRHLRAVGANGVHFGSAPPGFQQSAADDVYKYGKALGAMGKEERALQDALDDDEGYEEADDDFFGELMEEAVGDKDVMAPVLWGGVAPSATVEADEEFDAVLDEYDDELLGAMESFPEGLERGDTIEDYDQVLDEYIANPVQTKAKIAKALDEHLEEQGEEDEDEECRVGHGARTLALVPDDEEVELLEEELAKRFDRVTVKEDQYDCESVLSLRSNTSNHPGKICRPEKVKKEKKLKAVDEDAEEEFVELPEVSTLRPKGETPEERKARKAAVKEHQRMSRALKKETKELYKQERSKASARVVNAGDLRDGVKHFAL